MYTYIHLLQSISAALVECNTDMVRVAGSLAMARTLSRTHCGNFDSDAQYTALHTLTQRRMPIATLTVEDRAPCHSREMYSRSLPKSFVLLANLLAVSDCWLTVSGWRFSI